jgi:transcriptional regulator with XRE-family HTH domain
MHIAENIKRLRRARDITQDELASLLSITPQAVSKWEQGGGLPDISMLPTLAETLDCTVDELLGMEKIRGEELRRIIHKFETDMTHTPANLKELMSAVRRYPTNVKLLHLATMTLPNYAIEGFKWASIDGFTVDEERAVEVRDFAIMCAERVLKYSDDIGYMFNAYYWLIWMYCEWEMYDKAEEIAMKFPSEYVYYDRDAQLAMIRGRRRDTAGALAHRSTSVLKTYEAFISQAHFLVDGYRTAGKYDDAIAVAKLLDEIDSQIYADETDEYHRETAPLFCYVTCAYLLGGDHENALVYLEKFVDSKLAEQEYYSKPHAMYVYNSPLFRHRILPEQQIYNLEDPGVRGYLLDVLGWQQWEPVRADPRFIALTERVEREGR